MSLNSVWFDLLNVCGAIITIVGGASFIFKKAFDSYKQKLAKLNKKIRLIRINKLRRQYFISKSIESSNTLLISYCAKNIGAVVMMLMMMSFIGFIFLYLEHNLFKLAGGFYMLFILALTINYFDEFVSILVGLKKPNDYRVKLKKSLSELRVKCV